MRTRLLGAVAATCGALMTSGAAVAQSGYGHGPRMMWDGMWPGWVFGPGMVLVITLGLILLGFVVGRAGRRGSRGGAAREADNGDSGALAILKARFARGEIDEAEFQQRKRALRDPDT